MLIRSMAIALLGMAGLACGAEPVAEEYQVKGAFLLNFTKFVDWPAQAFKKPGAPIAICVLGENPFGPELDRAAGQTVAGNRRVSVRQVSDEQQARECQIVFIGGSRRKRSREWLEALQGSSILTVGEFRRVSSEWRRDRFQAGRGEGSDRNRHGGSGACGTSH